MLASCGPPLGQSLFERQERLQEIVESRETATENRRNRQKRRDSRNRRDTEMERATYRMLTTLARRPLRKSLACSFCFNTPLSVGVCSVFCKCCAAARSCLPKLLVSADGLGSRDQICLRWEGAMQAICEKGD